ncbi:uncharacterized protein [Clytia hemisphaerica]|uniref:uncharacterized protein n=1 Tax=Clytia hemisphaerica TaxID=252671 RepID=UPI0034D52097
MAAKTRGSSFPSKVDAQMCIFLSKSFGDLSNDLLFVIRTNNENIVHRVCVNAERGRGETGGTTWEVYENVDYAQCSQNCKSLNYGHLMYIYNDDTITTGQCVCAVGSNTFFDMDDRVYCNMNSYGAGSVDGQWSPWSLNPRKCLVGKRSKSSEYAKERYCAVFPPTYNSGQDICNGSSLVGVGGGCDNSFVEHYTNFNQEITIETMPGELLTYKFGLHLRNVVFNDAPYFNIWVNARDPSLNHSPNGLNDIFSIEEVTFQSAPSSNLNVNPEVMNDQQIYHRHEDDEAYAVEHPERSTTVDPDQVSTSDMLEWEVKYRMTGKALDDVSKKHWLTFAHVLTDPSDDFEKVYMRSVAHKLNSAKTVYVQEYFMEIRPYGVTSTLIPGDTLTFFPTYRALYETAGHARIYDVIWKLILPAIIYHRDSMYTNVMSGSFQVVYDSPKSTITYMIPFMDPTFRNNRETNVRMTYKFNDMTMYPHMYRAMMDINYCNKGNEFGGQCDSVNQMTFKEESHVHDSSITAGGSFYYLHEGAAFRIQNAKSGKCLYVSEDSRVKHSSAKCKDSIFKYNEYGAAQDTKGDCFYSHFWQLVPAWWACGRYTLLFTKIKNTVTHQIKSKLYWHDRLERASYFVTGTDEDGNYKMGGAPIRVSNLPDTAFADWTDENDFLKLPVWPGMENMILKGIVMATTSLGETMFVCALKADLITKSNCFLTKDQGLSWKGLSPFFTYFEFIVTSTDYVYGKCLHAKYYCRMKIEHTLTDQR